MVQFRELSGGKNMNLKIPNHIAIIMDGNGRWAQNKGLPRTLGHRAGVKSLRKTLEHAGKIGVKYLTVFAFSTENWKRSSDEVGTLMMLFKRYIKSEEKNLMEKNVRFVVSGTKVNVSEDLLEAISKLEEKTKNNTGIVFNIAFNYGGRTEIIDGINAIILEKKEKISEEEFSKYLYNSFPDPDLLIRTSGEMRISNFLLWQLAYSEIVVTEKLWPDFTTEDLDEAILDFTRRDRRFGGVNNAK